MKKRLYGFITLLTVLSILFSSCSGDKGSDNNSTSQSSDTSATTTSGTKNVPEDAVNYITSAPSKYLFKNENNYFTISPKDGYEYGEIFVNYEAEGQSRGGHLGHAMVEYADGKILDFYPNCNSDNRGHSGRGWTEYKRSVDYGKTWSEPIRLEHSYNTFQESYGKKSVFCEKAVVTDDGTIILFCLNCDVENPPDYDTGAWSAPEAIWEPYFKATYMTSNDGGETWNGPYDLTDGPARIYDALYKDGEIFALSYENGTYKFYVSSDNGKSFAMRNTLTFPNGCFYGTMGLLDNGKLIVYVYPGEDKETMLYYMTSLNSGKTFSNYQTAFFKSKIRNPQFVKLGNSYFIFGRSGNTGAGDFIVYCSKNGMNWDSGTILRAKKHGIGAYSNTLVIGHFNDDVPDRVLVQASHAYNGHLTNVLHFWLDMYTLKID